MTAKNSQVRVTFEEKTIGILNDLAQIEKKSVSSVIRELTLEALELWEDYYFSKLAEKFDKELEKGNIELYTHEKVWNIKKKKQKK